MEIILPEKFVKECQELNLDPQEEAFKALSKHKNAPDKPPTRVTVQTFFPKMAQALYDSLNEDSGPFKAKYYPRENVLWFHLESVFDWWLRTFDQYIDKPSLVTDIKIQDYTMEPKAVNIRGKTTWCYGFSQPQDQPIIPLKQPNRHHLEWTTYIAPVDQKSPDQLIVNVEEPKNHD